MSSKRAGVVVAGVSFGIAVGTAFGVYVLGPHSGAGVQNARNAASLEQQVADVEAQLDQTKGVLATNDTFLLGQAQDLVKDRLVGKQVLIVATPSADPNDVAAVANLVGPAGGTVSGQLTLTNNFLDRASADAVKTIAATTLPAGVQLSEANPRPGYHVGQLLGGAFLKSKAEDHHDQSTPEERNVVRDSLTQGQFVSSTGDLNPADVAIIVTAGDPGTGDNDYPSEFLADLAQGMDANGGGVVLAGRLGEAEDNGSIARVRAQAGLLVSTVDDVNHVLGQVSAIRAAAMETQNQSGAFGSAQGVTAFAP